MTTLQTILDRINALGYTRIPHWDNRPALLIGNPHEADASRADALEGYTDRRERNEALCRWQTRAYGYRPLDLGTNIYGPCLSDPLRSNLTGARSAITPRKCGLIYVLKEALRLVENNPGWVSFRLVAPADCSMRNWDADDATVLALIFAATEGA